MATSRASERRGFMSYYRQWLGLIVIAISAAALAVVSWVAIAAATDGSRAEMTRLVFASIVPLLGTWVGTVLAYNFSRENFEAAAQQTKDTYAAASGGVSTDTPVVQVMLQRSAIVAPAAVTDDAAAQALTLKELNKLMTDRNVSRLPLFNTNGAVLYVIAGASIASFAVNHGLKAPDFGGKTVGDLLGDLQASATTKSFETIGLAATVGEARAKLQAGPDCRDVFVTEGGGRTDAVRGWLTNNDLARAL